MSYTEQQESQMRTAYLEDASKDTVIFLAEQFEKSPKSIIAKLSSMGIYQKATPVRINKLGEPVEKKSEFATQISTMLGVDAPSLVKAEKRELKLVRDALQEIFGELESD